MGNSIRRLTRRLASRSASRLASYSISYFISHSISSLAIYFVSFKTTLSLVNYEVERLERDLKREETRVTVTILDHYKRYCEEHYKEAN